MAKSNRNPIGRLLDNMAHEAAVLEELPIPATKPPEWIDKIGPIVRSVSRLIGEGHQPPDAEMEDDESDETPDLLPEENEAN